MTTKAEATRERLLAATKQLVMSKGFAGMAIDDVLKATGLTKGAFFHHFRSKKDLADQLMRWYAEGDLRMFRTSLAQAEAAYDDPMEQLLKFLTDFEAYLCDPQNPPRGCMYALYTYEDGHFESDVKAFVAETLQTWTAMYIRKFQEVIDRYPPAKPVTAKRLAEMMVSVGSMRLPLIPATIFFRSPFPGAVRMTLLAPLLLRCWDRPSWSRQTPVLSIMMASLIP